MVFGVCAFLVLVDLVTPDLWIWLIVGLLFAGLVWYCGLVIWWFRLAIWMMGLVIWVLLWADLLVSCRFDIIYVPGLLVCCYGYCVGWVLGLPTVD